MSIDSAANLPLTELLHSWQHGDGAAFGKLFDLVYDQLKRICAQRLRHSGNAVTFSPTELLHEAVLRVVDSPMAWNDRAHFFAIMSLYIRSVLVDQARARLSEKRGGRMVHVTLTNSDAVEDSMAVELLALDQALARLETLDARSSEVLQLTYFAGLKRDEIAATLRVSIPTVDRELRFARAWLHEALGHA